MSTPCGCTPGTYENGWQEQRAPECDAREMEAWRVACDLARTMTTERSDR